MLELRRLKELNCACGCEAGTDWGTAAGWNLLRLAGATVGAAAGGDGRWWTNGLISVWDCWGAN